MTKKAKIISLLLVFSIILFFYLVLSSKIVTVKQTNENENILAVNSQEEEKIDLEEVSNNHKKEINEILESYTNIINDLEASDNMEMDELTTTSTDIQLKSEIISAVISLKNKILELKAPSKEFGSLHMKLILSLTSLENYLNDNNPNGKEDSGKLFEEVKNEYELMVNIVI